MLLDNATPNQTLHYMLGLERGWRRGFLVGFWLAVAFAGLAWAALR